jgi:hypothetical protein
MELFLKLSGILLGVLARTLLPYLRKLMTGKIKKFEKGYWLTAGASFILSVITTLLIFPKFEIVPPGPGVEGLIRLFCAAFGFGFAWNSIVNEAAKWTEKPKSDSQLYFKF